MCSETSSQRMMGRDARALLALLAAAALLTATPTAAGAPAPRRNDGRRLRQATAIAESRASAAPGGTAVSNVGAGAVSTGGQPATAVARGASVAEAGQTVRTDCNVYAENSEQYKVCINAPPAARTNVSANVSAAAAAGVVSWEAAKTCSPNISVTATDTLRRLWGYENGASCAFKTANGSAIYAPSGAGAGTGAGGGGGSGGSGGGAAAAGGSSGGGGGGSSARADASAVSNGGPASASANAAAFGRRRRHLMNSGQEVV